MYIKEVPLQRHLVDTQSIHCMQLEKLTLLQCRQMQTWQKIFNFHKSVFLHLESRNIHKNEDRCWKPAAIWFERKFTRIDSAGDGAGGDSPAADLGYLQVQGTVGGSHHFSVRQELTLLGFYKKNMLFVFCLYFTFSKRYWRQLLH